MTRGDYDAPTLPGFHVEPRARARATDPQTSHDAAASLTPDAIRKSQAEVLVALYHLREANDLRIIAFMNRRRDGVSRSGTETRRKELQRLELVADSGQRERMPSGRGSIVWTLTDKGRDAARQLIGKQWGLAAAK